MMAYKIKHNISYAQKYALAILKEQIISQMTAGLGEQTKKFVLGISGNKI
jgi:hypothetical protein